jgi:uncharacterized protein (DUF2384 family)
MPWVEALKMPGTIVLSELIGALMRFYGISTAELARTLQTPDATIYRWLADQDYPQHQAAARANLAALESLASRLLSSFGSVEAAQHWLKSPSGYLGGRRPMDELLAGRIAAVDATIEALDAGIFV